MKIKFSKEADILLLNSRKACLLIQSIYKEGIILHLDNKDVPIEMEILDASTFVPMDEFSIFMPLIKDNKLAIHV